MKQVKDEQWRGSLTATLTENKQYIQNTGYHLCIWTLLTVFAHADSQAFTQTAGLAGAAAVFRYVAVVEEGTAELRWPLYGASEYQENDNKHWAVL